MTDLAFSPSVQVDGIRDVCRPWAMLLGGRRADRRVSDLRGWRKPNMKKMKEYEFRKMEYPAAWFFCDMQCADRTAFLLSLASP